MGCKQNQHSEYFQPPDQHAEGAYPGLEIGQPLIIAGGPDRAEPGATIVYRGKHCGKSGDEVHAADQQHKGQRDDSYKIQEDKDV